MDEGRGETRMRRWTSRGGLALGVWTLLRTATPAAAAPSRAWRDPVAHGATRLLPAERHGRFLLEVSLQGAPSTTSLSPRLSALAATRGDLRHRYLELGSFESPLARRLGIAAVPAFFLYRDGVLVARGSAALDRWRDPPAPTPDPAMQAALPLVSGAVGL